MSRSPKDDARQLVELALRAVDNGHTPNPVELQAAQVLATLAIVDAISDLARVVDNLADVVGAGAAA